jgi:uncharacterized protein YjdB
MTKNYLRYFSLLAAFLYSLNIHATTFEYNGFTFNTIMGKRVELAKPEQGNQLYAEDLAVNGKITVPQFVYYNDNEYTVVQIGSYAFSGLTTIKEYELPPSITIIEDYAFFCNYSLEKINLPEGLVSIGQNAFFMTALESLVLPQSLTTIKEGAFTQVKTFKKLDIPDNVETIGNEAFISCSGIESLSIGAKLKTIGSSAFLYCYNISSISVSDDNPYIISKDNVIFNNEMSDLMYAAPNMTGNYVMPNSVLMMERNAMTNSKLNSIKFSENLASTQYDGITNCGNLETIVLPSSVVYISQSSFSYCENLKYLVIGEKVREIGKWIVTSDNELENIICYNTNPPIIKDDTFDEVHLKYSTLYVPDTSIEAYKQHELWSKFQHIEGLAEESSHYIPMQSIEFKSNSMTLRTGETVSFDYSVYPSNCTIPIVRWESSDEQIAKVKNDKLFGYAEGVCDITAYSLDGTDVLAKISVQISDEAGIDTVESNSDSPSEYYNLQGIRFEHPIKGLNLIRHSNGVVEKKILQ